MAIAAKSNLQSIANSKSGLAVAYYRTSSAANVGTDKDSLPRQRDAVLAYANSHKLKIVREFYDPGVSGTDPVQIREGFSKLLEFLATTGTSRVLVETASRFARDLAVQIAGHDLLKSGGFELIPVDSPEYFVDETPTAVMVRQILGAVSQFEKAMVVDKLRRARDRKRAETGRCEGRPPVPDQVVKAAKRLYRINPKTHKRRSLRVISKELAKLGYFGPSGKPYEPSSVKRMVSR